VAALNFEAFLAEILFLLEMY